MSNINEIKPIEDFDWDALEGGTKDVARQDAATVSAYESTLSNLKENEIVIGKITSMNKREFTVSVGFKSEGTISASEFRYNPELKAGDEVEVFVNNQENKDGQLVLSHTNARKARAWKLVEDALEQDAIVVGHIKSRTKGGMIVDVFGIDAFLPGSQIDVRPVRNYDEYVDKHMEFKIVKINNEFKNVVVSHKVIVEAELEQQKAELISKLEPGQILEGVVKNITNFGAFVDLGGIDGLIHITDLSWGRVSHPSEVVSLDQQIQVVVLEFNQERKRIALGLKQLTPHPWDALVGSLEVGDRVKGKVVVLTDYGAFVEIAQGVEGLVHVSEMSWSQLRSAQDSHLKVGDEIEVVVLSLDREERKMSLGMKQLKEDPWTTIEERFPVGSKHTGRIRNFTNFGVFVEIEEGVDGLIHISDLSWTKKFRHPSEFSSVGNQLDFVVLGIDKENRRLSLGHKQLEEDPWAGIDPEFREGAILTGTVKEAQEKGLVIALPNGVEGFTTPKHLTKEDGSQAQVGETLEFKVVEFNRDSRRVFVSHSRVFEDAKRAEARAEEREARAEKAKAKSESANAIASNNAASERATLGDLDVLAALKDKLS